MGRSSGVRSNSLTDMRRVRSLHCCQNQKPELKQVIPADSYEVTKNASMKGLQEMPQKFVEIVLTQLHISTYNNKDNYDVSRTSLL